jgi:tetratricopeptide (TPR) repeat protein
MTHENKQEINKELEEWENMFGSAQKGNITNQHQIFEKEKPTEEEIDAEVYFSKDSTKANSAKVAENERNKGNEAIKSKDYNESIKYYSNSIKLDPSMYQSYGNRALAYLKIKCKNDQALRVHQSTR